MWKNRAIGAGSFLLRTACLGALVLLVSCQTPKDTLPETWATLEEKWRVTLAQDYNPELAVPLAWDEAVAMLRDQNLKLQRASLDIQRNRDTLKQIYWNLVPLLNVQARADTTFRDISSFGWNNLSLDVNALINVPGIVNMQANIFGARLMLFRAEVAWYLAEREQTIELYRSFRTWQSLQRRRTLLEFAEHQAGLWQNVDPFQAARQREEIRRTRRSLEQEEENLQQNLHRLVGLSANWWEPQFDTLPAWDYLNDPLILEDLRSTGFLQSLLLATEIEGAAARIRGIRLQYWPDLSISITGPPLYQSRQGRSTFWNAEDMRIFANAYWQIDTQGRIGRQLRQAKEDSRIQMAELELQASEQARRLIQAQTYYRELSVELEDLNKELLWLQELLRAGRGSDPVRNLQAIQTLAQEQDQLQSRMDEIFTLFWFVDERRWTFDHEWIDDSFEDRETQP